MHLYSRCMAIDRIHLRKLLQYFGLPQDRRIAAIRADAREFVRNQVRGPSGGGDFHTGFWADAKSHASGQSDLFDTTAGRIAANWRRQRLYPALRDGFLLWWNENRRWINEEITARPNTVNAPHDFLELDGRVKVENVLALQIGDRDKRLIYPYFAERPELTEDVARLGLWLMSQALRSHSVEQMRLLDVLRGRTFSVDRSPLRGDEGAIFVERYARMLADWRRFVQEFSA